MFRYRSYDYWLNLPTRQSLATCAEIIVALEDRSAEWHRALLGGADPSRSLGDDQVTSPGRDPAMVGRGMRKSHGENGKTHGIHGKMIYKCWVNFEKWSRLQEGSWLVMGQKNTLKKITYSIYSLVTNHLTNPIAYLSTGGSSHDVFGPIEIVAGRLSIFLGGTMYADKAVELLGIWVYPVLR